MKDIQGMVPVELPNIGKVNADITIFEDGNVVVSFKNESFGKILTDLIRNYTLHSMELNYAYSTFTPAFPFTHSPNGCTCPGPYAPGNEHQDECPYGINRDLLPNKEREAALAQAMKDAIVRYTERGDYPKIAEAVILFLWLSGYKVVKR